MAGKKTAYKPDQTYDLQIKIRDLDFTADLQNLTITSSLSSPYHIFEFVLAVDPNDITLEGIFGEDTIKLNINNKSKDGQNQEQMQVNLMLLDTDQPLDSRTKKADGVEKRRTSLTFIAIPVDSFKTITTNVNKVLIDTSIKDVINTITSETNAQLELDSEGINSDKIDQVVIPPTTLYRIVKERGDKGVIDGYLDKQFGIFDGITATFCNYENKLKIMNLTKRMNKSQEITIHQLAEGTDDKKTVKDSGSETMYTYSDMRSLYHGNTKFASISKKINYITKPHESLYEILENDLSDISSKYGLIDKNKKIQFHKELSNRIRYNIGHTGNDGSEIFAHSDISSLLKDIAAIEIDIERTFDVKKLLNIGSPVKFKPQTIEYSDYGGKYILFSTFISFNRNGPDWESVATLRLIRSNKTSS